MFLQRGQPIDSSARVAPVECWIVAIRETARVCPVQVETSSRGCHDVYVGIVVAASVSEHTALHQRTQDLGAGLAITAESVEVSATDLVRP